MAAQSTMHEQIEQLRENGFVVVSDCLAPEALAQLNAAAREQLAARVQPA